MSPRTSRPSFSFLYSSILFMPSVFAPCGTSLTYGAAISGPRAGAPGGRAGCENSSGCMKQAVNIAPRLLARTAHGHQSAGAPAAGGGTGKGRRGQLPPRRREKTEGNVAGRERGGTEGGDPRPLWPEKEAGGAPPPPGISALRAVVSLSEQEACQLPRAAGIAENPALMHGGGRPPPCKCCWGSSCLLFYWPGGSREGSQFQHHFEVGEICVVVGEDFAHDLAAEQVPVIEGEFEGRTPRVGDLALDHTEQVAVPERRSA